MTVGAIFAFFVVPVSVLALAWIVAQHYEHEAEREASYLEVLRRHLQQRSDSQEAAPLPRE